MSKAKIFFWACLAFIFGIALASFVYFPQKISTGFSTRFGSSKTAVFTGIIDSDPEAKDKSQQFSVRFANLEKEKVLVITNKYPEYRYGDKIGFSGQIKAPENFEGFDYQGYLAKDGIYAIMAFPKVELLERGQGNPVREILFSFKNKFRAAWRQLLSPPYLGIFEALTFGEEGNIPSEWKEKLNLAGVRHLTAVSGMNITIITFLLAGFLLKLGFWRRQAGFIALLIIWLYILMIGMPSSGLRAGLMASLVFLAQVFGRQAAGFRILVFSAAVILAANPLLLRYDVGFQLSFLAILGLIFWQPFFKEKVFKKLPDFWQLNLSTTFAAQVFTLPLVVYNFNYISLISPLTNILLVPLIPYLTMISFIAGILGMVLLPLGRVLALPLWLGLEYILKIVDLSLKIPFASLKSEKFSLLLLVVCYLLLIFLTRRIQKKHPYWLNY